MAFLTVNSQFTPYTFDELIRPFAMYDAAYQENQARTDALLEKAAQLEDLSPTIDKETYDSYQEWKNQLKAVSDELATNGLNNNTRRVLNSLSNRYSTDYLPTVAKLKARGELIKDQREYLQKHPNAFFDVDYSTTPVDKVSSSSTFNAYDLDEISNSVATDSYSRLASGQKPLTPAEYMSMYGSGITDKTRQAQVANAISSGMALASANHQQKEFENYMTRIRTTRTGSGGSGGSRSSSRSGSANDLNVPLPDGTSLRITYNKKTGEYEYKDANKGLKTMTTSDMENATTEDILKGYYGGYYGDLDTAGGTTKRVLSDNKYSVLGPKGWVTLPKGGNTTYRELLKDVYGVEISLPREDQLRNLPMGYSEKELNKKLDNKKISKESISIGELSDYADHYLLKGIAKKLQDLEAAGLIADDSTVEVYIDNGNIIGYDTNISYSASGRRLDEPIEQDWKDNLKSIKEAEANGPFD